MNIVIINGPNLNLLGEREPKIYGKETLKSIEKKCKEHAKKNKIKIDFFQSNIEGEIVTKIQKSRDKFDGLIINAAAFTHTSVAILDALNLVKIPKIEIHISNILSAFFHQQLESLQRSLLAVSLCQGRSHNSSLLRRRPKLVRN